MASRHLNRVQFQHYTESDGTHGLEAWLPGDAAFPSGELRWHPETGEVHALSVEPKRQRQGVATALWNEGQKYTPAPVHSRVQTKQGAAWARSVGGASIHE